MEWKCSNMVPLFMPNAPYFYCINNITSYVWYRVMVWCVAPGLLIDTPRDRVDIINSMALCNLSSNVWKLSREKGKTNQENMVGRLICGHGGEWSLYTVIYLFELSRLWLQPNIKSYRERIKLYVVWKTNLYTATNITSKKEDFFEWELTYSIKIVWELKQKILFEEWAVKIILSYGSLS